MIGWTNSSLQIIPWMFLWSSDHIISYHESFYNRVIKYFLPDHESFYESFYDWVIKYFTADHTVYVFSRVPPRFLQGGPSAPGLEVGARFGLNYSPGPRLWRCGGRRLIPPRSHTGGGGGAGGGGGGGACGGPGLTSPGSTGHPTKRESVVIYDYSFCLTRKIRSLFS